MMGLQLRKAVYEDMDLLYEWVNDDLVRANAFHTEKIPYENHVRWFESMMADADAHQYILYEDEKPIGQVRLNVEAGQAVIDYSIAPCQRKKGYGSRMLQMIPSQLGTEKGQHITKLIGQVKYENRASARAFEKSGYHKKELPEYVQYEKEMIE